MKLDDPELQITRKLDQAVGSRYHEDAGHPARRRRNAVLKGIIAAACAIGAAALVIYGIESHRLPTAAQMQMQKSPPKPVTVQIIPAKPPP
jgi:hypothetical protein